ncbi:MAG: hypothetical protein AMXMBFR12_06760 [Candidatus Babeliales bacterium]
MKKLFFLLLFSLHTPATSPNKDLVKKELEVKNLKQELYELESQIFYTKHLSLFNTLRDKTAFLIGAAGLIGSCVTPFKFVKSSPHHPYRVWAKRAKIAGATLAASISCAAALTYIRPILWLKEEKKKRLQYKIFELQKNYSQLDTKES